MSSNPTPADTATATAAAPRTDSAPIPPPVTAVPVRDRRPRDPQILAVLLFAAYATLSVCRWRHLATRSWDLGIFEQAVRAYAHLRAPVADLKGPGTDVLGDHFSPVIALLAPVYRLFPTPVTLLVAQAALLALSVVPVTRAAARLLGRSRGLALGLAYGLSWGIQRAVDFDFHEICFAVPLIAFALEAVLERRWRAALLWPLPLVLVKEDLGLTLAAIALVVAGRARKAAPRTALCALGVAALGVLAAVLTLMVVIPAFSTADTYPYWDKAGGDPLDGLGTKLRTLAWLLIPTTGLLAPRSPLLLVALPTLGWRFLSSDPHYWGTDWHYSAVLMPVLSLALADALFRTRRSPRPWLRSYAWHLPTAVVAAALALTTSLPLSVLGESAAYRKPTRVSAVERLLARVPDGASVEVNVGPSSRLVARCRVLWMGDTGGVTPDFIALDDSDHSIEDVQAYAGRLHPRAAYDVLGAAYGYVLLERRTGHT
ncbi:DUF2079 domain-containing protein [Streptomyces sp. NBC_01340]|uniref:DUF2079 domain-containing protein n=1 Tax=unclassified Streptomyces TaxID=2593676 RepID=UPI0022538458|nr:MULTISPECIES: DUF2079 domain-containing protein [unclassified Streptomyces]MCX4454633.1 DUF2079 domain-containing protein [Streptomyces sp. NBC_01719]MCX4493993.1 DUF2079 domain-containing protein [Streptomyces sp. NBC_01728]WSI39072.1 DUF2079 domain-containing protein [Streptomyces sp. NBC_01340]